MIEVSISVEGQTGLTWPLWKRWVAMAEARGFSGLYRSDHFTMPDPPDEDSLECIVSLAYLADHSSGVRFGPLVAPLSFRDPVMLAPQAVALDDLSGGRMVLGVGTGWIEREHSLFGYELGDLQTRFARLEEGLEVITHLLQSDEPVPRLRASWRRGTDAGVVGCQRCRRCRSIRQGRLITSLALVSVELLMTRAGYLAPTATTLRKIWPFHGF
jgi:alkanesulfonate monooxygenase SsuD/methylene tetrahydromethanopterin reductase-like flavin-dependent oxidoreductase (luciferase family)